MNVNNEPSLHFLIDTPTTYVRKNEREGKACDCCACFLSYVDSHKKEKGNVEAYVLKVLFPPQRQRPERKN